MADILGCPVCGESLRIEYDDVTKKWDGYCVSDPSVCPVTVSAQARTRDELRRKLNQRPALALSLEMAMTLYMLAVAFAMKEPEPGAGAEARDAWQAELKTSLERALTVAQLLEIS